MERYRLVFRRSVSRDLKRLPARDVARILERIDRVAEDPRGPGCEKLSGDTRYRARLGIYRILYEIKDDMLIVTIVKVGHRQDIYRRA